MKMGKKVREYKSGDFIFAKVKGYPAWPARVQRLNGKKYFVYFYGTGETANLPPNMIFDYAENKDKFLTKTVKRRDFNDGVKQIEYDFANNVPLEQVVGALAEASADANTTANESTSNDTMDDTGVDTTATDETMADDANTTQNDTAVEDSDDTGTLVIDEGKKGRKSTAKTPAKEPVKAKEPKTPRGKAKKEETKEEEGDKKEEEIVSRSGRKIRPKRYIDEQTEENTTLPSPAPKKRRAASPQEEKKEKSEPKEKEKSEPKEKGPDKTMKHFNTVTQSELADIKEPFKSDMNKINLILNKDDEVANSRNSKLSSQNQSKSAKHVTKKKKFVPPAKKTNDKPILKTPVSNNKCLSQTFQSLQENVMLNQHWPATPNTDKEFVDTFHNINFNYKSTINKNKGSAQILNKQHDIFEEHIISNKTSQVSNIISNAFSQMEIDNENDLNTDPEYEGDMNVNNITKTKMAKDVFKNKTKNNTLTSALLNSLTILNDEDLIMSQNILTPESLGNDTLKDLEIANLTELPATPDYSSNTVVSLDKVYKNLDASSFENRTLLYENINNCSQRVHNVSEKEPNISDIVPNITDTVTNNIFGSGPNNSDKVLNKFDNGSNIFDTIHSYETTTHKIPVGEDYLKLFQSNTVFNINPNSNIDTDNLDIDIAMNISNNITESTNATKNTKETTKCVEMTTIYGDMGFKQFYSEFIKNSSVYIENENEQAKYSIQKIYEMYGNENRKITKKIIVD